MGLPKWLVQRPTQLTRPYSSGRVERDLTKRVGRVTVRSRDPLTRSRARSGGSMTQVEVVHPDTGATHIEYRRDGRAIGAEDPEAGMSVSLEYIM